MKKRKFLFMAVFFAIAFIAVQCKDDEDFVQIPEMNLKKGKPVPATEVGNNLSYPVIWAEGVAKVLPGTPNMIPLTGGVWWYQWGTNGVDPDVTPASCPPDPDADDITLNPDLLPLCDDGIPEHVNLDLVAGFPPADNPLPLAKAFLQKDAKNIWQAGTFNWLTEVKAPLNVNWIDWGDNLESNDWYTRSQVRTEVVLFQDLLEGMLEYEMRHTSGWGIDEVHGLATNLEMLPLEGPGNKATVYSHCARLTIQKLLVDKDNPLLTYLEWDPGEGWITPESYIDPLTEEPVLLEDLINPHIFNGSVHDGGDGPGYYSAEINVKGRIIYGYTWNVRQLNDNTPTVTTFPSAAGVYRLTFSFDEVCGAANLNTSFVEGITDILLPEEVVVDPEGVSIESDDGSAGGTAVIDFNNNLTYMDVRILERGGESK